VHIALYIYEKKKCENEHLEPQPPRRRERESDNERLIHALAAMIYESSRNSSARTKPDGVLPRNVAEHVV
jgi:hypothetical protein